MSALDLFLSSEIFADLLLAEAIESIKRRFYPARKAWPTEKAKGLTKEMQDCLQKNCAVFVTLQVKIAEQERLRGCIGTILPREPLYKAIRSLAPAAAFEDPRFPPLSLKEAPRCSLELSVLSPLSPCSNPEDIVIGRDGVLLRLGRNSSVFLPEVALEQGWDLEMLLSQLAIKAGLSPSAWKEKGADLSVFRTGKRRSPAPLFV